MADSKNKTYTYPYPRPSLTVDVAVLTRDARPRVLLIRRNAEPFAGTWALPGGFVDENERLADAVRRELKEETGVEPAELEQFHTFGDPGRDPRGWTVSVVHLARIKPGEANAVAGDDAGEIGWFPVDDLPTLDFDHSAILARVREHLTTGSAPGR